MAKNIYKVVLTGGPAAGKTTLISRILKEFDQDDGWRVITIPETATELISGFGLKPFGGCMSMLAFQDFVIADQIHKEALALKACDVVEEENILILYDRALMDDKAYISDDEFKEVIARFDGRTEESVLNNYDMVLHLVTCAKGAEFAYDLGNTARTESVEYAREMDDRTLRAWKGHHNLRIIDNSVDFDDKLQRAVWAIQQAVGREAPAEKKQKFLVCMPDVKKLQREHNAAELRMVQTYLMETESGVERRARRMQNGKDTWYFYSEKHHTEDSAGWVTERRISETEYERYLKQADPKLQPVEKVKYRFVYSDHRFELDIYPFSKDRAILFRYATDGRGEIPSELNVLKEVTGEPEYKNKSLAGRRQL